MSGYCPFPRKWEHACGAPYAFKWGRGLPEAYLEFFLNFRVRHQLLAEQECGQYRVRARERDVGRAGQGAVRVEPRQRVFERVELFLVAAVRALTERVVRLLDGVAAVEEQADDVDLVEVGSEHQRRHVLIGERDKEDDVADEIIESDHGGLLGEGINCMGF